MGQFSFDAEQRPLLLKVSNIGFQTKWLTAMSADLGVITLQPEATRLNEVVVTAKKATVTRDGLNYSISNLSGTHIGVAQTVGLFFAHCGRAMRKPLLLFAKEYLG